MCASRCIPATRCRSPSVSVAIRASLPARSGLITEPTHAAEIVANQRADLVFVARVVLADPAWPLRAAKALGVKPDLPPPYWRATLA